MHTTAPQLGRFLAAITAGDAIDLRKSDGVGVVLLMNGDGDRWGPVEDIEMELLGLAGE